MDENLEDIRKRLIRLEESQGFAERSVEQLAEEVRALGKQVAEVRTQLRRLEAQLVRLSAPSDAEGSEQE